MVVLLSLAMGTPSVYSQPPAHAARPEAPGDLPASLHAYFPPASPAPLFLLAMHKMNTPLSGLVADLFEHDAAGMQANYLDFKLAYTEAAALVPEWKDQFPQAPVDELGAALPSGDPARVMPAVEKLAGTCHSCHVKNMVPVQQKYSWPSFKGISLHDPITKEDMDFVRLMVFLNTNFSAVETSLKQGQPENARSNWQAFRARFGVLRESCEACHDSPRTYFVDPGMEARLEQMTQALAATTIDQAAVAGLGQSIGQESCRGCHLVHVPAAYSPVAAH